MKKRLKIFLVIFTIILISSIITIIFINFLPEEKYCEQDADCKNEGLCNSNYSTKEECEFNLGTWHGFVSCHAIGCPPPQEPCCELPVKCLDNKCKIISD